MADANVSVSFSASINDFVSGVGQAKDALQSFSAPFGEINAQLSSLATASSQAFNPSRLQPYRDALDATKGLQQSFAADAGRAAAALRAGDDATYADAARAAQLAASEEVKVLADGLKQKLALYAEEARFYEITQQQKLAAVSAGDQSRIRRRTRGAATAGCSRRAIACLKAACRRHAHRSDAPSRRPDGGLDPFGVARPRARLSSVRQFYLAGVNSQLRGLLTGTTTWHTAFKNALEDLLIKFIEWCETSVARYVLAEAMKTAATTAGVAARTGAEQGGAAASLGAQGATMIRSILSSAAETFAGVFGFLAPLMGPLAIGPAAAAQATVAGMAGAVASADIGMWQVPRDQLALIHQNELIMPAGPAGALRDMLTNNPNAGAGASGGSVAIHPTTHFHVNAMDGASVASWMRSNGPGMAKALDQAVRHGAALGLKRLNGR